MDEILMKYSYKFLDVQNFFKKRTTIDKKFSWKVANFPFLNTKVSSEQGACKFLKFSASVALGFL